MTSSTESFDDERMWPTWYTVQVWNDPDDLFMKVSYHERDKAVAVAQNLERHYDDRMYSITLKRWNYEPTPWELEEVEDG